MKRVSVIHLSDIHYENSQEGNEIIEHLKNDLAEMKKRIGTYDLLIITGDCVNRGHVEYFGEFKKRLKAILKEIGLDRKKVVIVAGNHDASVENMWLKGIKKSETNYGENIKVAKTDITPLFPEFNNFVKEFATKPNGVGAKIIKLGDNFSARIIMINSSWSTFLHNKYGELYVGEEQLDKIREDCGKIGKKYDITIACMHHPLDWFTYEERVNLQDVLYRKIGIDILLHGHIHDASFDSYSTADLSINTFCTGISYNKKGENSSRKDGMRYSIYEIDKELGTVNLYLRATGGEGKFTWDNRLYSAVNKNGYFTLPLGNTVECTYPLYTVNPEENRNILLNRENVKMILTKEDQLFDLYCGMEKYVEEKIVKEIRIEKDKFEEKWKLRNGKNKFQKGDKAICEKEFYIEQFELYCMHVLNVLNSLFFVNHKHVRFLLRRYEKESNCHVAYFAEGIRSTMNEIKKIKSFKWGEGMIFQSYKMKAPLLMSCNVRYHAAGNSKGIWKDYLTMTIGDIEVKRGRDLIPLLVLNIAVDAEENEHCLQALALTSINQKMQRIFRLYNDRVHDLVSLYTE